MNKSQFRITKTEVIAKAWSTLWAVQVDATMRDGRRAELKREVSDHGHGAAILAVDPKRQTCLLVRQWRVGVAFNGEDGFLVEVCAGLMDADQPEECARREALEELGTHLHDIQHVCDSYASPGAVSEKLSLFVGFYSEQDRVNSGGGLLEEGEDIEVLEMPIDEAYAMIASGDIIDAKTIILLQHVKLQNAKS